MALATAIAALAGFGLELVAFWPGLMSVDSIVQYTQAATGHYSDQHPPIMAWLWSWTNRAVSGPGGMLIVHLALLWIGLWAIAEGARRRGLRYPRLVLLVGLLPTIANIGGVIWKDVGMAYALLCAGGLLYLSRVGECAVRTAAIAIALVLIGYATMVRANAAAAAFALAWYWVATAFPRIRLAGAMIGGAVALALMLSVQQLIERKMLDASRQHLSQLVMLFDLTAIRCGGADVVIPEAYQGPRYDAGALCRWYDVDQVDKLFFLPDSPLRMSDDEAAYSKLPGAWLDAVIAHPNLYLSHHARAFAGLLGLRRLSANDRYLRQSFMQPNPWGFTFVPNAMSRALDATVDALANSGLFSGWLWLGVAVTLLAIIVARRRMSLPFESALLASAIMYLLPYFVLSLAPNYRFMYWSVLATSVAGMLIALRGTSRVAN
jgi:hypothetical protein